MSLLSNDILERLSENKKLYERPGVGKYSEKTASFIGMHGFWVLLLVSFISTVFFLRTHSHWWFNDMLFGRLYR